MPARFFQIGFSKCGTTAISRFFARNGFACVDWDGGRLAQRMKANLEAGRSILEGYEHYEVFTDMVYVSDTEIVEGFKYFGELRAQVPGARFILNTRNCDNWVRSQLDHGDLADRYRSALGLPDLSEVVAHWRKDWAAHHAAVTAAIPAQDLLVFDIEADPPTLLTDFAGLDRSAADGYAVENITLSPFGQTLRSRTPAFIRASIPAGIRRPMTRLLRKRR